jgi:hypothetical protein
VKKFLFVAGVLLLAAPVKAAMAHDDDYYMPYFQRLHQELEQAHEDAHDEGFQSQREHRDWHQAYGATHEYFHEDHPGTWHDHRAGYGGGGNYHGYPPYNGFTWSFGR